MLDSDIVPQVGGNVFSFPKHLYSCTNGNRIPQGWSPSFLGTTTLVSTQPLSVYVVDSHASIALIVLFPPLFTMSFGRQNKCSEQQNLRSTLPSASECHVWTFKLKHVHKNQCITLWMIPVRYITLRAVGHY